MKVIKTIIIILFVVGIIGAISFAGLMIYNVSPIEQNNKEKVNFIVDEGMGQNAVIDKLEKEGLIRSAFFLKIYLKINGQVPTIKAGRYEISKDKAAIEVLTYLGDSKNIITATVTVKFIEGKKFPYYVSKIAENFDFTEETIYNLTNDETYLKGLINKYWFIDESILNKDLYYPLEGYLFPDTYTYERKDVKVETIIEQMLDNTEKVLKPFKEEIEKSDFSVHEIMTLASMAELEAGNNKDDEGITDRAKVVGVFINRINKKMKLGSDVTAYYAFKVDLSERDLTTKELNTANPYNTRGPEMEGKLPVGPICNPSVEAIEAAVHPYISDYLYFVSDKNNVCYFTESYKEHQDIIKELKNKKMWYTYDN
jgi:UPF0755 protein